MRTFQASIRQGDKVIVKKVTVYLEETTRPDGIRTWYGVFQLAGDDPYIEPDKYRIHLDDNRSGEILVTNVTMSSHAPTQVTFMGSGPLGAGDGR